MNRAQRDFVFRITPTTAARLLIGLCLMFGVLFAAGLATGLGWAGSPGLGAQLAAAIAGVETEDPGVIGPAPGSASAMVAGEESAAGVAGLPATMPAMPAAPAGFVTPPVLAPEPPRQPPTPRPEEAPARREAPRAPALQLGAFALEENALRLRDRLREIGYDPVLERRRTSSGTVLHHVRIEREAMSDRPGTAGSGPAAGSAHDLESLAAIARSVDLVGAGGVRP